MVTDNTCDWCMADVGDSKKTNFLGNPICERHQVTTNEWVCSRCHKDMDEYVSAPYGHPLCGACATDYEEEERDYADRKCATRRCRRIAVSMPDSAQCSECLFWYCEYCCALGEFDSLDQFTCEECVEKMRRMYHCITCGKRAACRCIASTRWKLKPGAAFIEDVKFSIDEDAYNKISRG